MLASEREVDETIGGQGTAGAGSGTEDREVAFERMARSLVGQLGLKEAQALVRSVMIQEALTRTGGSRRAAAKLLGVTRRYVQLLLEEQVRPE